MIKQQLHGKQHGIIIILAVTFLLSNGYLFAQEQYNIEKDYFILPLKHISVQTGMKFLGDTKVDCTYTNVPGSSTIVVRSRQKQERDKAKVILNLVDTQIQYAIEIMQPASITKTLPTNEKIIAKVGNISIGSFINPPSQNGTKVIIDTHDDSLIVIAPKYLIEKIISAITQITNEEKEQFTQLTEPIKQELSPTTMTQEQEPDIVPALFAQNVNKKTPEKDFSEERITAPVEKKTPPVKKIVTEQSKKLETVPQPLAATESSEPLPILNPDDEIILNLEGKLTLIELLGFVGPYLQMDFAYNESDLANKDITFSPNGVLKGPIKIRDAYDILETVFRLKGLIMTRGKGNIVTILPLTDVLDSDPELLKGEDGKAELGDSVVISLFKINHIDLASAQNLLNGMKLTTSITPLEQTKTLIVTGYASRMSRIKAILEIVDKPGEPKEFRFRKLDYTSAKTLSPKIKTLAEQLGTISITVTGTSLPEVPQRSEPKRPEESNAEYQRRLVSERQAREAAARAQATIQQPSTNEPTVYLEADERTNRILMIGLKEQLDEVEKLINTLDVAQQDLRTLQLYKIENLDAEDVRDKLQELNIIGETSKSASSQRISGDEKPATQSAVIRNNTSDTESSALAEEPKVVVIEPTNTLLVYATAEQHMQIASIINFVDRAIEDEEMPYKMYQLRNTNPEHVYSVIEPLIQETVQDAEGKIEKVEFKQDDRITIVSDPNTSSLIVNANKKNQEWIGDLIEKLDKRRPQVLIDVTLVQISKTDQFDYDLNLLSSFPDLTDTSGVTTALMPGAEGTNLVKSLMDSPRGHFVDFQTGGGSGTGFFADKHINALLTAMQQKDYGRVLATPKILVNDNQEGMITATDVTYVTRTSSIPVNSGAAGEQTNLIQTETDYEPYDAGITLRITPHISESDLLRLDIYLERSDFGTITGDKPPDTQVSNVETNVTVPDGSTIILGGLQKLNQSKGGTKVPLLGDIPLIGGVFRAVSNSDIQRNLYVFVKAEVIRPPDDGFAQADLERISNNHKEEFEKQEREFQKYESWPGIISEPMKPWKVLEN